MHFGRESQTTPPPKGLLDIPKLPVFQQRVKVSKHNFGPVLLGLGKGALLATLDACGLFE